MIRESLPVEINASPTTVWQHLTTPNAWQSWHRDIEYAERLTAGIWTPGYLIKMKTPNERATYVYTISQVDMGRSAAWSGSKMGLTRAMSVELKPREGGTVVTLMQTADGPRTFGPLGWLVRRGIRRNLRAWADGLRRAAASGPAPGA